MEDAKATCDCRVSTQSNTDYERYLLCVLKDPLETLSIVPSVNNKICSIEPRGGLTAVAVRVVTAPVWGQSSLIMGCIFKC